MFENIARDFYQASFTTSGGSGWFGRKGIDVIGMTIYTIMHAALLTLEMFTLHVAITSSEESVFSFLFYNNFTELKITVFKKVDVAGLYQYAANDSVERLQLQLYLANIILSTS